MRAFLQLLRLRQWVKNGFVLVPVFFGRELSNTGVYLPVLAATAAFCLASSAVYIFNDWRDVEADRHHAKKRSRPLASGAVSTRLALGIAAILAIGAIATVLVAHLPPFFLVTLAL